MRSTRRSAAISIAAALALGYAALGAPSERPAVAQTERGQSTTEPTRVAPASQSVSIAGVPHAPDAVVRTDVLRSGAVVVVADREGPPSDWSSSLHRVDPSGKIALLATGLYHASRPLASIDGAVYVQRGTNGPWPTREEAARGRLRTDPLHIDAIDPFTGAARTLYAWTGYTLHLAGELAGELLVYRVAFEGADLVAIDRVSGRSRLVTALVPFARDFLVDEKRGALVMSNRDEHDSHLWVIDRIDLATGFRTRLTSARDETPSPLGFVDATVGGMR